MSDKQKIKLSLALLALSLVLIGLSFLGNNSVDHVRVSSDQNAVTFRKNNAPQGQIIAGFPNSLILDSTRTIQESYMLDYKTAAQYTVQLATKDSVAGEYQKYLDYLNGNFYDLVFQRILSSPHPLAAVYARSSQGDIAVQISADQQNKTKVIINYLNKN